MSLNLVVVTVATRPTRKGPIVADWFVQHAKTHGGFAVSPVDLADMALPVFDEPEHPMRGEYAHAHTKRWSEAISPSDAVVFVTPEYNHFPPPSLVNAVDYLHREWHYKPIGFVSYAGVSGGAGGTVSARIPLITVKAVPIAEAVSIPFFQEHLGTDGFEATDRHRASATRMLDELAKLAEALKPLRG